MNVEILGLAGVALIAITLARMLIERQRDVLHGPYLHDGSRAGLFLKLHCSSVDAALDRLRSLESRREYRLA